MNLETPNNKNVVFPDSDRFEVERVFPIRNLLAEESPQGRENSENANRGDVNRVGTGPHHQPAGGHDDQGNGVHHGSAPIAITTQSPVDRPKCPPTPDQFADGFLPPPYPRIPSPDLLRPLNIVPSTPSDGPPNSANTVRRVTERSQMVPHISGAPGVVPGVVTGSEPTFYRCEDEPIHIPGAIQQFGALVAVKYDKYHNLKVRIASENTKNVMHHSPERLFMLDSFLDIVDEDYREDFSARLAHALDHAQDNTIETHLDCFSMCIAWVGFSVELWCAIHISEGTTDLIILEFEEYTTPIFNLDAPHSPNTHPLVPIHTIENEITPEERAKSVTSTSAPLRVLQIARRRQNSGLGSMEIFTAMTQVQQQLAAATSVTQLLEMVVGLVSELTGFHRVMAYRFDGMKNGCVVSELVDPKASADIFRGLNFPASDIPKQARDLYLINRIRVLYDRDEETARFLGRKKSDFETPLDLTHSYLRAMSPIHIKYLTNLGVRSTMSISIVVNGDLWGLIACHHYGHMGLRVPLPLRELCRNIGECVSTNIDRLLMVERIAARKPLAIPQDRNPSGFIAASSSDLLKIFGADFGLLSVNSEGRAIGRLSPYRESLAILAYLQGRRFTSIQSSQNINADFPDLKYPPGIKTIAGLLVIPLSHGGNDFIVFFRKAQLKEVLWAGNPYEKVMKPGSQYLEPRASFRRWTETVGGTSRDWNEDQLDTASVLSLLYGRFIEIWRQKESAGMTNRMTRILLRNSSHEVRTPLNAIVNYLEIALENPIDESTKENLQKAYKASRSLIYVIDDLLNLTKVEDGRILGPEEFFDLGATVSEVMTAFRREAVRKHLDLTVSTHPGIPEMVKGDPSRLRQTLSNIIDNAFQNSVQGGIQVDIRPLRLLPHSSVVGIQVQDVGHGMSEKQLDDLFQEFEQILDDDEKESTISTPSTAGSEKPLGLGLAVVARYVRNMNGQIRVKSDPGKGTIFGIELPFEHATIVPNNGMPKIYHERSASPSVASTSPSELRRPSAPSLSRHVRSASLTRRTSVGGDYSNPGLLAEASSQGSPSGSYGSPVITPSEMSRPDPFANLYGMKYNMERRASIADVDHHKPGVLNILIAEDNPINARLLNRRLSNLGHNVEIAQDGQICYDIFSRSEVAYDVILMDLQMPLVDGHLATRMIRLLEKATGDQGRSQLRIPIVAVSASLMEESRFEYLECGFDAWILKPVDFWRLEFILRGIKDRDIRQEARYTPGSWYQGGWFLS